MPHGHTWFKIIVILKKKTKKTKQKTCPNPYDSHFIWSFSTCSAACPMSCPWLHKETNIVCWQRRRTQGLGVQSRATLKPCHLKHHALIVDYFMFFVPFLAWEFRIRWMGGKPWAHMQSLHFLHFEVHPTNEQHPIGPLHTTTPTIAIYESQLTWVGDLPPK